MHFGCVCLLVVIIYSFLLRERSFFCFGKSLISKESVKHTIIRRPKKKFKFGKSVFNKLGIQSR